MSGVNLKCPSCGREFMVMAGSPFTCTCGAEAVWDRDRPYWCPRCNVRYGVERHVCPPSRL